MFTGIKSNQQSGKEDNTKSYFGLVYCAVLERPLQELREELQTDITEALASYRKHCCSASVSAGQVRFRDTAGRNAVTV